jgi:hypothetical protein
VGYNVAVGSKLEEEGLSKELAVGMGLLGTSVLVGCQVCVGYHVIVGSQVFEGELGISFELSVGLDS